MAPQYLYKLIMDKYVSELSEEQLKFIQYPVLNAVSGVRLDYKFNFENFACPTINI